MPGKRPDRVVRVLTVLVSIAYYVTWAAAALVLIGGPLLRLLGATEVFPGTTVPVTLQSDAAITSRWGEGALRLSDMRGTLEVARAPAWFLVADWLRSALEAGVALLFLHHLRRLFQELGKGAPFVARNAVRLRWLGWLLVAAWVVQDVFGGVLAIAARRSVVSSSQHLGMTLGADLEFVFAALVLLALAEVFRHGAELEDERALVI